MGSRPDRADLLRACLDAFAEVESAEAALSEQLGAWRSTVRQSRRFLEDGGLAVGLSDALNVTKQRAATDVVMRRLEAARVRTQHALYRLTAADGMNAAEIGRVWGVSRQLVSRVLNEPDRPA